MYQNLECSVRATAGWRIGSSQTAGVRQGDTLVPTLFAIFINDFVQEITNLRCGVPINEDTMLSTLLCADDIVLISDTPDGLQNRLHTVNDWSSTWKLKVNDNKSKIVHFRRESEGQTQHSFIYGDTVLEITPVYQYLGMELHETLDYAPSVKCLTVTAGRALCAVTNKYFSTNGLDYHTYTKLLSSMVCPIMDYGSEVWAGKKRHGLGPQSRATAGCNGPPLDPVDPNASLQTRQTSIWMWLQSCQTRHVALWHEKIVWIVWHAWYLPSSL